jgi:hypothetical protein
LIVLSVFYFFAKKKCFTSLHFRWPAVQG